MAVRRTRAVVLVAGLLALLISSSLVAGAQEEEEEPDFDYESEAEEAAASGQEDDGVPTEDAEDYNPADTPVLLVQNEDDFERHVNSASTALVEFYAPWCGHCQELKPKFEMAAQTIKEEGIDAVLVAVNAEKHKALAAQHNVQGFPTLIVFKNGTKFQEYDGAREADEIVTSLEAITLPLVTAIDSVEAYDSFVAKGKVHILAALPSDSSLLDLLRKASEEMRGSGLTIARVAHVHNAAVWSEKGLKEGHATLLQNMGESLGPVTFKLSDGLDASEMANWANANSFPLLVEMTPAIYPQYEKRALPFVWSFLPGHGSHPEGKQKKKNEESVDAANEATKKVLYKVAEAFAGRLSFMWLSGEDYADHAEQLGVNAKVSPALVLTPVASTKKYIFKGEMAVGPLEKWIQQYLDGQLEPDIRSEAVPETNDGPVKVLVAQTLNSELYASDNDVFVEFYAPWCGHCQSLAPTWTKLGLALQGVKGITIAKIDATANDVPEEIEGFPMLYLKKASDKARRLDKGMFYEGEHTLNDLLAFLRDHSSAQIPASGSVAKEKKEVKPAGRGDDSADGKEAKIQKFLEQFDEVAAGFKVLEEIAEELRATAKDEPSNEEQAAAEALMKAQAGHHEL